MDAVLLLLKASLLLSLTLLAARLLARAPAVTRHGLWTFVFGALLALPLLASALPALYVPVPTAFAKASADRRSLGGGWSADRRSFSGGWLDPPSRQAQWIAGSENSGPELLAKAEDPPLLPNMNEIRADERRGRPFESWSSWQLGVGILLESWSTALLLTVWLTGTIAAAGALFISLLRARRLARTAKDVVDPAWRKAADTLSTRLGLRRPARLLVSPIVGTPMAGGVWRPVIFLPASAHAWSTEHRDVVLAHEIAHLAGHDPLRHVVARLAVALYWFHPLAWIAARQATFAREQACDETVLALGTPPSAYARVLLDLAESMNDSAPALGALPMVERSLLETRLMAILNDNARPAIRRRRLIPALGVGLLTLSVAAAQPLVPISVPNVAPAPETITAAQPAHVAAIVE